MEQSKKWYKSLGSNGGIVAAGASAVMVASALLNQSVGVDVTPILPLLGIEADPATIDMAERASVAVIALFGSVVGLVGRWRAKHKLTL